MGKNDNMAALRAALPKHLREIRLHFCQNGESSKGVRYGEFRVMVSCAIPMLVCAYVWWRNGSVICGVSVTCVYDRIRPFPYLCSCRAVRMCVLTSPISSICFEFCFFFTSKCVLIRHVLLLCVCTCVP